MSNVNNSQPIIRISHQMIQQKICTIVFSLFLIMTTLIIGTKNAYAVADQNAVYTITIWKIHPGKHVEFIKYMQEWEEVFKEVKAPPMKWYRKISGDSYDFISISAPFDNSKEHAMEAAGKKRGLPVGYNYTLKLNEYVDSYTSTYVEGPQTMAALLAQVNE